MTFISIPLSKLTVSSQNVRKTGGQDITELKASIAAHGLFHNLQVIAVKKGKYEVIAGGRRLLALQQLAEEEKIAADYTVPCQIAEKSHAVEISLAENAIRLPMHPADQYDAFKQLHDEGRSAGDIAARFGTTEQKVQQRLKLSAVSPVLLEVYRKDGMTLEQLSAFTLCDDHERQENVWKGLNDWNKHAYTIRRALTEDQIASNDMRALYIGADAYYAAGGTFTRDLFSEAVFFNDVLLLEKLVAEKLDAEIARLKSLGWKWCVKSDNPHERLDLRRVSPQPQELNAEESAALESVREEYDILRDEYDMAEDGEAQDIIEAKLNALEEKMETISGKTPIYKPEDMARSGVVIMLRHDGTLNHIYGLVSPQDRSPDELHSDAQSKSSNKKTKSRISAGLVRDLTAQRTAAMQAALLAQPKHAFDTLLHTLVCNTFFNGTSRALMLSCAYANLAESSATFRDSTAHQHLTQEKEYWRDQLPDSSDAVWQWLDGLEEADKHRLLTYCVVITLDTTEYGKNYMNLFSSNALPLMERIPVSLADWWQPTAENYFSRISKSQILDAVEEEFGRIEVRRFDKLKKSDAAVRAERLFVGKNWLPQELRKGEPLAVSDRDEALDEEHVE